MTDRILCLGEALVDVVLRAGQRPAERVGGSLFNTACGLAALQAPTSILSWWGRDERGSRIADAATRSGVEMVPGTDGAPRTPLAYAHVDAGGVARYEFELTWEIPQLPDLARYGHLHTGSFAATLAPGAAAVGEAVRKVRGHGSISYDPNIRPALMGTPEQVLPTVTELIAVADVVKASDEDIAWLYPGDSVDTVLRRWIASGPALVVITLGAHGARALLAGSDEIITVEPLSVTVGDTVGAGDSFMAGLLSGLIDAGYLGSRAAVATLRAAQPRDVAACLHRAIITSGITVSHSGAYAPRLDEVNQVGALHPRLA